MYYQTTNLKDRQRAIFMSQAKSQDEFILKIFQQHDYISFTPSQILELCEGYGKMWPITSIRRSLNTLSNDSKTALRSGKIITIPKKIIKLDKTSISRYGRPEHQYKLV